MVELHINGPGIQRTARRGRIEVHLIASGEAPGGIGETGTTAAPPAVGNAIYAATGVRLRRLPIDPLLLQRKS
jgi:CO/xanthine dehydrogenase Mo-binding subunit